LAADANVTGRDQRH